MENVSDKISVYILNLKMYGIRTNLKNAVKWGVMRSRSKSKFCLNCKIIGDYSIIIN